MPNRGKSLQYLRRICSYPRLLIALAFSVLIHLFLFVQFYFHSPESEKRPQIIEARLIMAKEKPVKPKLANARIHPPAKKVVVLKPLPAEEVPLKPAPLKPDPLHPANIGSAPVKPEPQLVVDESDLNAASLIPPPDPLMSDASIAKVADTQTSSAVPSDSSHDSNLTLSEQDQTTAAEDIGIIVNSDAYHYVETIFDVRTDINASVRSSPAGKATVVYELLANSKTYQLKSLMQAKGLAALVIPDLLQTSKGSINNGGLQPEHYLYQFGTKKNKTNRADFDWEQKKLNLHNAKGAQTVALTNGAQDLLSFMYQFMFVAPLQTMHLNITNGKKLSQYAYSFAGEETIDTKMGNLSSIHLVNTASGSDEKTELWLSLDYQYVPVKIRKTEKDGRVYELLVTALKTEKPDFE